jgi:segregation and condensation protein A
VQREELSVREHMGIILRELREVDGFVEFIRMFDPEMGVAGVVVHFLAMLELAREHLVEITQTEAFEPIYVRLADGRITEVTDAPAGRAADAAGDSGSEAAAGHPAERDAG